MSVYAYIICLNSGPITCYGILDSIHYARAQYTGLCQVQTFAAWLKYVRVKHEAEFPQT